MYRALYLLLPLWALGGLYAQAGTFVYSIDSQEKFARMNTVLTKAIADGETDIVMDIAKGVYYFGENHLIRRNELRPDVSVRIQGHDAVLIAAGNDYHAGDRYETEFNPHAAFVDTDSLTAFDFWDECRYAEGLVEVVDEEAKRCRLWVGDYKSPPAESGITNPLQRPLCQHSAMVLQQHLQGGKSGGRLALFHRQETEAGKARRAQRLQRELRLPDGRAGHPLQTLQPGQRSMLNGQRSMFNGQWSMVNGQWSMVNGQWSTDHP